MGRFEQPGGPANAPPFMEAQPSGLHRCASELLLAVRSENLIRIDNELQAVEAIQVSGVLTRSGSDHPAVRACMDNRSRRCEGFSSRAALRLVTSAATNIEIFLRRRLRPHLDHDHRGERPLVAGRIHR